MVLKCKKTVGSFLLILAAAAVIRLLFAAFYYNEFDLVAFNIPWAIGMGEHGFSVYGNLTNLDYPPLVPFLLWSVSAPVAIADALGSRVALMFWIKLWPVVFDLLLMTALWLLGRKKSEQLGFAAALFWALNPAAILNCALWGQTDCMMMLLITLSVWAFWEERPVWGTVWFAVGCLTKLQMAYFAPILLCELFFHYRTKIALRALLIGFLTGILGWLPFMIGAGSVTLPFDIYLGGFDTYNYLNLNSYNIYGIFGANWVPDDTVILGPVTFRTVNAVVMALILLAVPAGYYTAWRAKSRVPFAFHALFLFNAIFILATKMHERYQMPVVILLTLCWLLSADRRLWRYTLWITVLSFFNQGLLLFAQTIGVMNTIFYWTQPVFSLVNVLLFVQLLRKHQKVLKNEQPLFVSGNG